ncbi:MAG: Fe-S protein assembly co-chaperone HscB [Acidihalobacter sp.]|jgi:molecular chaperone HscB|uniref:Fe-S protein assembly co-chaperone HscB n=1 Tax=Acidihalobacter sp. TaxID=1872108 RepID=UPI00307DE9C7
MRDVFDPTRSDFELFDLEPAFELDIDELQSRYRELQSRYHPDRHAAGEAREQREALQAATRINEAYCTLRDPRLRARYLLVLANVALDEERDTLNDPEFLMTQLELREALDEAQHAEDALTRLDELHDRLRGQRGELIERFARHYAEEALEAAKADVLQMSFFDRLLTQIEERLSALEDALD